METNMFYSVGDWVVHKLYGVGQIKGVEARPIHGESLKCFRVKTKDSTFWFPIAEEENPRIRHVASEKIMERVIKTLRRKASYLDTDRKYWKEQIAIAQSGSDLIFISKLIRDLSTQQALRKLNQTEERALDYFRERLLREWAVIMRVDMNKVRPKLNAYIQESKDKLEVEA
jgi:RNA polymerase-interacting CarD/CdnL/TRCF family regulator